MSVNDESLRASIPGGVGVRVKALDWGERRAIHEVNWAWDAKTSIDWYVVATASGEGCKGTFYWFVVGYAVKGWANSEEEAKAAAQADYERRILSALDLSPADTQCCMCGKTGLSTIEGDGGTECQLEDGRWTCSEPCWEKAGGYGPDLSSAEGEPVGLFRKSDGAWKQVPDEWADHPNVQPLYASPSNKEPVAVTDEMVERAVQAWPDGLSDPRNKIAMRAALTAALSVKPQSGSDKP
ncbi:hypothetical protein [Devosia elaeis]|uniref:Uncharacterized protein n=1 Tax=Devosia elaeis TaxID=1770058 RepID=A0A178I6S4_9HYPH|nr:hypothetical protein [Devosia elaeis]OAM84206.1 hypothetical protein A3840_00040 [Devosia elaeis]